MSSNYGAVREYRDDPSAPASNTGGAYQSRGTASVVELCDQIRSNIFQINNGANAIERAVRSIGTERDTPMTRDKIHEISVNTVKVVQDTVKVIRRANALRGDQQQKIQIERLTSDFQESVSRFQTLQKKAMEKVRTSVKLGSHSKPSTPLVNTSEDADDQQQLLEDDHVAKLQAQEVVIEDDLALLQEREERIRQLESDILDVNEIFQDLGAMVHDQGGVLNDIEANMDTVHYNVEIGNEKLVKAAHYQKKSRRKMCCLLVIFLVIIIIIVVVVVTTVN